MHLLCWDALSVIAFQWEVLLSPQLRAGHTAQCCWGHGLLWHTNLFILDLFAAYFL